MLRSRDQAPDLGFFRPTLGQAKMLRNTPLLCSPELSESAAPTRAIRVLIIDDHKMFVDSLARHLRDQVDIEIVGCAFSATTGLDEAETTRPDVAIIAYGLPDRDGIKVTTALRTACPDTRVLMLTGLRDERLAVDAFGAGCSGFLTKHADTAELVCAVRKLAAGESYVPSHLLACLLPHVDADDHDLGADLSSREREVLKLLATGTPTRAVADQLCVSVTTVRNHVQRILLKLSAHSKLEAVAIAVREGIIAQPQLTRSLR